jgi:hypothetical protein
MGGSQTVRIPSTAPNTQPVCQQQLIYQLLLHFQNNDTEGKECLVAAKEAPQLRMIWVLQLQVSV